MRHRFRRWVPALVFGIIGIVFSAIGGYVLGVAVPDDRAEIARIEALPGATRSSFSAQAPGAAVAVTVTLSGNATLERTDYGIRQLELVAAVVDSWRVTTDSNGDRITSWTPRARAIPILSADFDGASVQIVPPDAPDARGLTLSGGWREFLTPGDSGASASYNGAPLPAGSIRVRGLRDGDRVTVVGTRAAANGRPERIHAERLHAGDRASLLAELEDASDALRMFGIIFSALGGVLLVLMLISVVVLRRLL